MSKTYSFSRFKRSIQSAYVQGKGRLSRFVLLVGPFMSHGVYVPAAVLLALARSLV